VTPLGGPGRATLLLAKSIAASEDEVSGATEVLGLPLARRAALAASRAGFDGVSIVGDPDAAAGSAPAGRIILISDRSVVTAKILRELREAPLAPGRLHRLGDGAIVDSSDPAPLLRAAADGPDLASVVAAWGRLLSPGEAVPAAPPFEPASRAQIPEAESILLRDLVKAADGPMTRLVSRKISLAVTRRFAWTRLRPNAMTVLCVALGFAAAGCFVSPEPARQAIGGLLFLLHSILDGCDGELARLKFQESRLGGVLDFWGDNLVHVAVFSAFGIAWADAIHEVWPLALGALSVGATLLSAGFIYVYAMRPRSDAGPLLTTVSPSRRSRLTKVLDGTGNRDFIYLVALLGLFGKAYWFLAAASIGTPAFLLGLVVMARNGREPAAPAPVLERGAAAGGEPSR
jgi:1L-myo-inositol 1-phosphate cytidylyltransferase / CDP-L-myo-inositol myo-inositolphosphotransferase